MKILFNIHALHIGGAETVVTNYLLKLKEQGHDVLLVVDEREESFLQERLDKSGVRTISLRPQRAKTFWGSVQRSVDVRITNFQKRWKQILEAEKPDIVHLHSKPWELPFPAQRTVFTFHSTVERNLTTFGEAHQATIQRLADKGMSFFCLSRQAAEDIRRIFRTDRITILPNGVDLAQIRAEKYDRGTVLRELGIPEEDFVIGHIGRFHPVKNHIRLLEIFAEVLKKRPNSWLLLIGTGPRDYMGQVSRKAEELGISGRIKYLGLRNDATRMIGAFDAMVVPSLSESFSLALVEAQALDVRCVASDAVPAEVACNTNCFLLSLNEPDEVWADYVVDDFERAVSNDLERFDIYAVVSFLAEEYQKLLQK